MNLRKRALLTGMTCALAGVLAAGTAVAHNWGCWRQPNRTVYARNTAGLASQANAAIQDWDSRTILTIPLVSYHTEISVYDGYYGNTGWAGLASIESYSGCTILHGHARVNRSYSYTSNGYRGIFCQEVGHLFGLDHSNDGGCMGGGYYYSINTYYTVVQHNINDIYNKYIGSPAAPQASALPAAGPMPAVPSAGDEAPPRAIAFWHDRPTTLEEAVECSEAIVVGRVMRVHDGPDIVVPVEGLEDGVDRIPTQRVLFAVEQVLGGRMHARVFTLFRTGNAEFTIAEDPSYAEGERYVLFLTGQDRGTYRVIAPEGRYRLTQSGLVPSSSREFLSELSGQSIDSFSRGLARLTRPMEGSPAPTAQVELRRNAANPFTSGTSVSFAVPSASDVTLRVYDLQGRAVRTLVEGRVEGARWHTADWDGTDDHRRAVAGGVYFIRLEAPQGVRSVSVVRMR